MMNPMMRPRIMARLPKRIQRMLTLGVSGTFDDGSGFALCGTWGGKVAMGVTGS